MDPCILKLVPQYKIQVDLRDGNQIRKMTGKMPRNIMESAEQIINKNKVQQRSKMNKNQDRISNNQDLVDENLELLQRISNIEVALDKLYFTLNKRKKRQLNRGVCSGKNY